MYKRIYLDITKIILILGLLAFSFSITWNILEMPYIRTMTINGVTLYTYDAENYLNNIQLSWDGLAQLWKELIPTRTWESGGSLLNWDPLMNNLALIFDWIYMPINFILTILRTIAFIIIKLFSMLGIITIPNTIINGVTYNPPWFASLFNTIKDYFFIPYI